MRALIIGLIVGITITIGVQAHATTPDVVKDVGGQNVTLTPAQQNWLNNYKPAMPLQSNQTFDCQIVTKL